MSTSTSQNSAGPRLGSPAWEAHLRARLGEREALFWGKIAAMLSIGPPMCFIGPLAVSALIWSMIATGRHPISRDASWFSIFELTVLIMLPIMFIREWRAKRTLLEQAFLDGDLGRSLPSYRPYQARGNGDELYVYVDIFLIGPRQIIRAVRQWNERRSLRHIDRGQAASILSLLIQARTGVEIESLRPLGLDRLMIRKIIIYLAFFEWIDLSSDLTRAWVETTVLHSLGIDATPH